MPWSGRGGTFLASHRSCHGESHYGLSAPLTARGAEERAIAGRLFDKKEEKKEVKKEWMNEEGTISEEEKRWEIGRWEKDETVREKYEEEFFRIMARIEGEEDDDEGREESENDWLFDQPIKKLREPIDADARNAAEMMMRDKKKINKDAGAYVYDLVEKLTRVLTHPEQI